MLLLLSVFIIQGQESVDSHEGFTQQEAGVKKWQHPLHIPLEEVETIILVLIHHLSFLLSPR